MGKCRNRISRARRAKMPLIILEGKIRPKLPLLAAKFATECDIAVRNHVPVLQCWKDYKKKYNTGIFQDFVGKVGVRTQFGPFPSSMIKFHMDTEAAPATKACTQMMNSNGREGLSTYERWTTTYLCH